MACAPAQHAEKYPKMITGRPRKMTIFTMFSGEAGFRRLYITMTNKSCDRSKSATRIMIAIGALLLVGVTVQVLLAVLIQILLPTVIIVAACLVAWALIRVWQGATSDEVWLELGGIIRSVVFGLSRARRKIAKAMNAERGICESSEQPPSGRK